MGLVAPQHVGSSRTKARTRVPCIGRRILNHCATREVPPSCFLKQGNLFPQLPNQTQWASLTHNQTKSELHWLKWKVQALPSPLAS